MHNVNESKKREKLPLDFITQFISKGWDDTGNLKANIESIKEEFSGTKEVCDILQKYLDSYLITLSKLMKYIEDEEYLEIPEESVITEGYILNEDANDEVIVPTTVKKVLPSVTSKSETRSTTATKSLSLPTSAEKPEEQEEQDPSEKPQPNRPQMPGKPIPGGKPLPQKTESLTESVDFFNMDFDEPEPDYEADQAMQEWLINHSN